MATRDILETKIVGVDTPVTITGDLVVDTLGALDDAKVVNPDAATASVPALARGQLKQLVDILAKITAAAATEGKQDVLIAANHTDLAAILAKLIAAPSTEAKQDALIAANHTDLAAILAKIIAAPATEAKQDDIITALAGLQTALDTANGHLATIATNTTPA